MRQKVLTLAFILVLAAFAKAEEEPQKSDSSAEEVTTEPVIKQDANDKSQEESVTLGSLGQPSGTGFLPTLGSTNVVTNLVPSLKKNMDEMKDKIEGSKEEPEGKKETAAEPEGKKEDIKPGTYKVKDFFRRRRKKPLLTLSPGVFRNSVKNATAAEILLKKLQSAQPKRTYHDPSFKNKIKKAGLVKVRPRPKTLSELSSTKANGGDVTATLLPESSTPPLIAANAFLLSQDAKEQKNKFPSQGSQPFDWSRRQQSKEAQVNNFFKNRFRQFKAQVDRDEAKTNDNAGEIQDDNENEASETTTNLPEELQTSTEVHVVTSITGQLEVGQTESVTEETILETSTEPIFPFPRPSSKTPVKEPKVSKSYQYLTFGELPKNEQAERQANLLALEKLFMEDKLKTDEGQDNPKKRRKVETNGFFKPGQDGQPDKVQVNSAISVVSDLYENNEGGFLPSEPPTNAYVAPGADGDPHAADRVAQAGQSLSDLGAERVKDFAPVNAFFDEDASVETTLAPPVLPVREAAPIPLDQDIEAEGGVERVDRDLDDLIIKAVEEALKIDVPVDSKLRHRDASPRPSRDQPSFKDFGDEKMKDKAKKSYAFEYSVVNTTTGTTHTRKESSDKNGLVTGAYEVLEPGCIIRRVEYQAGHIGGFKILGITKRSCKEQQPNPVVNGYLKPSVPVTTSGSAGGYLPPPPQTADPKKYTVEATATILPPSANEPVKPSYSPPQSPYRKAPFSPTPTPDATPPPIVVSTQDSQTGYTVSTAAPPPQSSYIITATPSPIQVSSQSGIIVNSAEPANAARPDITYASHGATGQLGGGVGGAGINLVTPIPSNNKRNRKQRKQKNKFKPLYGGFAVNGDDIGQYLVPKNKSPPSRKPRPTRPQPVYRPVKPTYRPQAEIPPTYEYGAGPTTPSYDPFAFQTTPKPDERAGTGFSEGGSSEEVGNFRHDVEQLAQTITESGQQSLSAISVTPKSIGYETATESDAPRGSTIVPVFLTSDLPELRRVPKEAPPPSSPSQATPISEEVRGVQLNSATPRQDDSTKVQRFQRRNMLMNIILRPGGGDKTRALPRPKVDVKANGPNVIIIRMTFPDNENIQGLRAFTPTEPEAVQQFSAINELLPPNTSVERIAASSSEEAELDQNGIEYEYDDDEDYYTYEDDLDYDLEDEQGGSLEPQLREERQQEADDSANFAALATPPTPPSVPTPPPSSQAASPTRPPRPPKPHQVSSLPHSPTSSLPINRPHPLLGHIKGAGHQKRPRSHFNKQHLPPPPKLRRPPPPPPPKPPRPPIPTGATHGFIFPGTSKGLKGGKQPKLFIQSTLKAGNKDFNYNVAVDRQDWKPIPLTGGRRRH